MFCHGQIKQTGIPFIKNYPKSVYNAGTQNWGISQDRNGFMYFANNEGVLMFDGLHWDLLEVSNAKPVRSILTDSDNHIYVGLLNDFGLLKENDGGELYYKSLRYLLPPGTRDFDDVWKIYEIPRGIVFQTYEYLFILKDSQIDIVRPEKKFHFSFNVNGRLFLHEPGMGVFEYINDHIMKPAWSDLLKDREIWAILPEEDDGLLICTSGSGIYKYENEVLRRWDTPADSFVQKYKLYSAKKIKDNCFAFGTILNGLLIADHSGNILQQINRNNGLQNNTVLSLFSDESENLWLGLDNGIDYVEINSPVSYLTNYAGIGTGYDSRIFEGNLYLGTNQGLFVKSFPGHSLPGETFELVSNTAGQVWSLNLFDGQLLCGHNAGTFLIKGREALKISDEEGAWRYIPLLDHPGYLLGGHYNGLVVLKNGEPGWQFFRKIKGFDESCRFLQQSPDESVWISHGAKGIIRVKLNAALDSVVSYRLYTDKDGLPSRERNIVFRLGNQVFISGVDGIYVYKSEEDRFERDEKLNGIFRIQERLKTFTIDKEGNIWYIAENESGVLRLNEDSTYTKISSPFKQLDGKYLKEFEFVYPYDKDNIIIGIDNGFAHYSSNLPKSYSKSFKSFITKVELPYIDSIINFTYLSETKFEFVFPFQKNSFRFYYTSPFYENLQQLTFSYYLENYSDEWSEWSGLSFKDFTNLPEGEYVFKLKAKDVYDVESEISSFSFTITPPWRRSLAAYYSYLFLGIILLLLTTKWVRYRMILAKRKEEAKHIMELRKKEDQFQHQSLIAEKEIIRLRNDKLRADMVHRDKELANQTMNIIQKNKFLSKLKDELGMIEKSSDNPQLRTKLLILSRRLDKEIDNKQQNKIFLTYFEEVHEEFFKRLKEIHSDLSPREMNLCAYIRMNLTTKEIAALSNITIRGVEISRYRLRKKLNLSREVNLSTYLSNI